MRGLLVTGTDTGAGKTVVAAAIAAALTAAGEPVAAYKPVLTGLDEPPAPGWPPDHEVLAAATGAAPEAIAPLRFGPATSPHLAAELAGRPVALAELVAAARALAHEGTLVVEGVGGLLVPFARDASVRDLAVALGLPLVVAARPGLGTINHTLLTLEAARAAGLAVAAVVLTPWPERPGTIATSNRETIGRLGAVEVHGLPAIASADPAALRAAGAGLPAGRWLD